MLGTATMRVDMVALVFTTTISKTKCNSKISPILSATQLFQPGQIMLTKITIISDHHMEMGYSNNSIIKRYLTNNQLLSPVKVLGCGLISTILTRNCYLIVQDLTWEGPRIQE